MAMMYDRHLSLVTRNGHIPLVQTLEEHGNAGKVKENMDGTGVQCLTPVLYVALYLYRAVYTV